jgi:general secretion pathway protein G
MRKAFTMIELVFVIAIIGILASVAVPRFASTRNDAQITAAKATLASVKSAMTTQRQLRILRGEFKPITSLNEAGGAFSTFGDEDGELKDASNNAIPVLEGVIPTCATDETGCWASGTQYLMPGSGTAVDFTFANGQFNCDSTDENCKKLTY